MNTISILAICQTLTETLPYWERENCDLLQSARNLARQVCAYINARGIPLEVTESSYQTVLIDGAMTETEETIINEYLADLINNHTDDWYESTIAAED